MALFGTTPSLVDLGHNTFHMKQQMLMDTHNELVARFYIGVPCIT